MCYYTLTADQTNKEGHTRAILIVDAVNHEAALKEWNSTFTFPISSIQDGIHIPEGFDRLLTEHSRKYILGAKTNKKDAPIVSYCNKITLKHTSE
jgi:hypothetical protein